VSSTATRSWWSAPWPKQREEVVSARASTPLESETSSKLGLQLLRRLRERRPIAFGGQFPPPAAGVSDETLPPPPTIPGLGPKRVKNCCGHSASIDAISAGQFPSRSLRRPGVGPALGAPRCGVNFHPDDLEQAAEAESTPSACRTTWSGRNSPLA